MKRLLLFTAAAVFAMAQNAAPPHTNLKVGDEAPDFNLPSSTGKNVRLSDYRGQKVVVVSFFPAAYTGGCTKEMTAYAAMIDKFTADGAEVVAISTDHVATLSHWSKELNATYPMAGDHTGVAAKAYGVFNEKSGTANRATFVVNKDGKITDIIESTAAVDVTGAEVACSRLKH